MHIRTPSPDDTGHVSFSPVSDAQADQFLGYLLAPLAVPPDFQKRRIGTNLIEKGIQHLSEFDVDIVFGYGDPRYYRRFGFQPDVRSILARNSSFGLPSYPQILPRRHKYKFTSNPAWDSKEVDF
jgi:predicted N-acetyltransferase YhbS